MRRALSVAAALTLLGAAAASCSSSSPEGGAPPSPRAPVVASAAPHPTPLGPHDWPTYHRDNTGSGVAPHLAPHGDLRKAWQAKLDGAVYGQPLVLGNEVLAATENDTVYGLDAATGAVRWKRHLAMPMRGSDLPCGNIDPLGITSTMAYDPATSRLFAVAESTGGTHTLYGLDPATGDVEVRVPVEPPRGDQVAHQQRAALTVLDGRVYVAYGGLFGDCGSYVGSVASVTTAGSDAISYAIPTGNRAGIWAPGGAVVENHHLLYADGNGESTRRYDGSDSVIELSPTLRRTDLFAPSTWPQDNADDLDLGSASPVLLGKWVLIVGKRGTGYVLRRGALGGVGGAVATQRICRSFGGAAVSGPVAYLPCTDGPRAVTIDASGKPSVRWHSPVDASGSPVVGGGAVWVVDYHAGVLYALDPKDGAELAHLPIGPTPHFASPTLSGDHAYVGTRSGVVAVAGA